MAILARCCCCSTIRNGSIAAAIYSLLQSALALGLSSFKIHIYETHDYGMPKEESALFIATCVDLGFFSLLFLFSIILLYGVKNNKRFLLLPYIVCMTVLVILMCVIILLLVVVVTSAEGNAGLMELLIVSLFTGLNLYCVLCVTSLYQELKEGRYGMRAIYRAQGGRLPNADNPPEKLDDINNLENANFIPQYPGPPPPGGASAAALAPIPAPVPYPGSMMGAPPPYEPPAYPAETYPKAEIKNV